jgi:hypothetical protein
MSSDAEPNVMPSSMPTPPPSNQKAGSRKRQIAEADDQENVDPKTLKAFDGDEDSDAGIPLVYNCNQIRTMLSKVVDTGELTVSCRSLKIGMGSWAK